MIIGIKRTFGEGDAPHWDRTCRGPDPGEDEIIKAPGNRHLSILIAKMVRPIFCIVNRSPVAAITPMRHGPLSAATGRFVAGLALVAGFFAMGLAGADVAGAARAEGDWAHPAAAKHERRAPETTKLRNMALKTKVDETMRAN